MSVNVAQVKAMAELMQENGFYDAKVIERKESGVIKVMFNNDVRYLINTIGAYVELRLKGG